MEYVEALVKQLAKQSQAVMLSPAQATDALASIERLNSFREATGRKMSLLAAVSEFYEVAAKVIERTLTEVADGPMVHGVHYVEHGLRKYEEKAAQPNNDFCKNSCVNTI